MTQADSIKADLNLFFHHEMAQIEKTFTIRNPFSSLPTGWAGQNEIDLVVDKSHPLFIVAFTFCKLLSQSKKPQEEVQLLSSKTNTSGMPTGLGSVYLPVLRQAVTAVNGQSPEDTITCFRRIIGSLVLLFDPLSAKALSRLLGILIEDVGAFIPPLQSVLNVQEREDDTPDALRPIKLFYLSFRDFLVGPDLCKEAYH